MSAVLANVDPFLATLMGGGSVSETPLPSPSPQATVESTSTVALVDETSVSLMANSRHSYLGKADETWDWRDLLDYVVDQIERLHGPFVRESGKEYGIFNAFVGRWGDRSAAIARYAFETNGGYWVNAPITITRFTKGNDPFFALPISQRINQ